MANKDLLPPDNSLLLPADGEHAKADDLFDQMSVKLAAGAKTLGAKAAEIAAEQGPVLKEQAQKLGSRMADAAAQARDPGFWEKYKRRLLGSAAFLLVLAGGGYEIGCYKASEMARDAVDGYLIRNHLQQVLSYKDVSATPFGRVTLSGLRFESPIIGSPVDFAALSISGLSEKGTMPDHLEVSWTGLDLPTRSLLSAGSDLTVLIGSGFQTLKGDGGFNIRFSSANRELRLETAGRFTDAGSWNLDVTFANFNGPALANAPPERGGLFGPEDPLHLAVLGAIATLMTVEVKSVDGSLDFSPLMKRLDEIPRTALPADKQPPLFDLQAKPAAEGLVEAGMAPSAARDMADTLQKFVQTGAKISLKSRAEKPVPLFTAGGFLQPQTVNLPALLAATKISLSN